MNREFLQGLGLEKDAIDAIMAKHGSTIGAKETEITNLENEKQKLETKITKLENAGGDDGNSELKTQLETLENEKKQLEQQLADQAKQHKLETYVNSLGTKDPAYIQDKLKDVELNEEGEFEGIDERVEELKEAHPLLFEVDEPKEPVDPPKPKPWSQGNSTVDDVQQNPFSKEHWNLTEQGKLYKENPELYNTLKAKAGK